MKSYVLKQTNMDKVETFTTLHIYLLHTEWQHYILNFELEQSFKIWLLPCNSIRVFNHFRMPDWQKHKYENKPELLCPWQARRGTRRWLTRFLGKGFRWCTPGEGPSCPRKTQSLSIPCGIWWWAKIRSDPIGFYWGGIESRWRRLAEDCRGCRSKAERSRDLVCQRSASKCQPMKTTTS